ncbi:MAG: NAD(P)/FAD-dependent oxidoreductase [Gammaproteobacteria bacterium]|nr:NAD(P)/FAD-dependent oxidoreductase [Gammaproteobacteria bacterium]MBV9621549.1 NAD(P)/FAD-dependent oxidoreductase [Gammaproteobacteria bacterium]
MSSTGRSRYDAIVIGAGHNGLVNACYLARAGLQVLVLERNTFVGGAAVSRKLYDGFTYSNCSYVCSLLRTEIIRALELPRFGLQIIPYEGGCTLMRNGEHLAIYDNHDALRREIARHSRHDAEAYERYVRDMLRHCRFIKPLLMREPPDPTSFRPRDIRELLFLARHFHGLGEARMYDTLRFYTMSCADMLEEYFESEIVKAHLAGSSIIGTALGPRSPGSAYVLLHHYMGSIDGAVGAWGFARGGMGAITQALASSLQASGGEIRTGAPVEEVRVQSGRATGVVLESGEEITARVVVSNLDVKRTFLKTVAAAHLPPEFLDRVRKFKIRGSSGKLNIALDGLPQFPAIPQGSPATRGDMHITDTLEMVERAYDDWKEGRWSSAPYVDMLIPTQIDPTMTPDGKHYMSVFVQYCPYQLADGDWTAAKREAFGATVIDAIARHSPDFKELILHAEIRTPREIEAEVGLTEGNIFQGELTFDQLLFNRPLPGYAQYRAPVRGMYMCGSSTHPGGGVMGAPGANAAAAILRDLGRT